MSTILRQTAARTTVAALGLAHAGAVQAQSAQQATPPAAQLQPAAQRISDQAIQADHRTYESMQSRIKVLNDRGRPVRDYHLAKAQCWLDVSFHEYTRNDRSDFPQAALGESEGLVAAMEQGVSPGNETSLVNGAARLRPDLWQRAAALRGHAGFRCVQHKVACAEVELVHAGNEFNQQQWRHAKPYVQIAEDLIGEAQAGAEACLPPPVAAAPAVVPAPVAAPVERVLEMTASVLFTFDKSDVSAIRPVSRAQLDALGRRIQTDRLVVQSVRLVGHADRLNSTGQADDNQRLSEARAATIKTELAKLGIDPARIATAASGDSQQVQPCRERFSSRAEREACLLPQRRVDVVAMVRPPQRAFDLARPVG